MKTFKNALILGCGRSGKAAERLLRAELCAVQVVAEDRLSLAELVELLQRERFEVCVVSPGFGLSHPWVEAVCAEGIPLLSELELGWSRHRGKTIALTGSNGKSTAVKWICESLCAAGLKAEIGGNYGVPACEVVMDCPALDWLVLEVSSFQLETADTFSPEVAAVLNILPNHLDRHGSMETYWQMKARIFGAVSGNVCVVPSAWLERFRGEANDDKRWLTFGDDADYSYAGGKVYSEGRAVADLSGTLFNHPVLGACTGAAVSAVLSAVEVDLEFMETAARSFVPLPHRMQALGSIDGVEYINDSKATNLAAMATAVQGCRSPVHLIAGGLAKESDFNFVKEILAERVRRIYLVGKASRSMYQAWKSTCSCVECETLEVAFQAAKSAAKPEEVVLLSPGCASFDQFCSFEERGRCFTTLFEGALSAEK